MASIQRIRVAWSGSPVVGPAVSTFYADPAVGPLQPASVAAFFTAVKGLFPTGITWVIPDGGDTLNEADGKMISQWVTGGGSTVTSSGGTTAFAAGVGARLQWNTGTINRGRRVKGSTYLVPLLSTSFESNGTLAAGTISTVNTAAANLVTAHGGALCVWSRPSPKGIGIHSPITTTTVPDKSSWLKSRRQ